ncbi:ABC transporter ATP-binding protein [Lacrimispora defluvii]|uniref:ABC transporter ATP-binding protein n=1 Tax=Lacrimispora defluvii TaxID=2719233 RepID=A0ABX1VSU6_9FIRM|nr:ABC transporter ATP-binding protein [Lacrimispora defluvii]NNJ31513.1 ABC transporter ATP-binding protein [Lacrimispora defluvii]
MKKMLSRILKLSGTYRPQIITAFVCSVLEAILAKMPIAYSFFILGKFYDNSMEVKDSIDIGIAMVLTILLQILLHHISDRLQSGAGYLLFADKRLELGDHLRKLPMGYFTEGNIGKISSVLATDLLYVEEHIMMKLAKIMTYLFSSIIMILFLIFFSRPLGLIALVTSVIAYITATKMNLVSSEEADIRQNQSQGLTEAVLTFVEGIAVIKSYNLLGEKSKELSENFRKSRDKNITFEERIAPWMLLLNSIYAIGIGGIFGSSVWLYSSGRLSLPYLLGILLFVFELFNPLKALFEESASLNIMNSCLDRMEEILSEQELHDEQETGFIYDNQKPEAVRFDRVEFSYGDKKILKQISFTMKQNSMTAIIGPSGSGKSTIANLLARLWDVNAGAIYIQGKDIREISLENLMNHISMVFQRVYLFEDTIYNNILMGKAGATREEVYEAAKKARCYDFIIKLPDGFETKVGEGGTTLSGGEKQRISIARSILKDTPIVILDEATASVDSDNERYIQEAINELVKGKTLLVIAHRLHTIKNADQILVVENGEITERGVHEELMEQGKTYFSFHNKLSGRKRGYLN